jgi:hypothetical protein
LVITLYAEIPTRKGRAMKRVLGVARLLVVLWLGALALTPSRADADGAPSHKQTDDFQALPLPALPLAHTGNYFNLLAPETDPAPNAPTLGAPDPGGDATPNDSLEAQSVEWGTLLKDSMRFLAFEHSYRMAQQNTRDGFSGPFFQDYFNSIANIHGWGDGDPFTTNYIGHPIQGAISGDIWITHDPRYRRATFDLSSKHYWISRLRASAFAAVYSLQFEIGPISEASLGNVQQNPRATGVVDWVITPTMGLAWMVGEDAVDEKLIAKWESKTDSRAARILLRGLLNPSRSMSNLMALRAPWHRDTRPGITQF